MGILRTDRVAGLGGANAIKGSVEFRADQNIRAEIVNGNADFNYGSGDFTIECWWNSGGDLSTDINFVTLWNYSSSRQAWGMYWDADDGNFGLIASTGGDIGSTDITYRQAAGFEKNRWYHLAIVRISNTLTLYKDGTSIGSNSSFTGTIYENTVDPLIIGGQMDGTSESSKIMRGFISNLRIIKGEGIYTGNFTPPTNELTVTPNTVLLACQSPGDILHEATGKKLIAYRRTANSSFPVASRFTPHSPSTFSQYVDQGTNFGSTFDGVTTFDSQAYMVPPGGITRDRHPKSSGDIVSGNLIFHLDGGDSKSYAGVTTSGSIIYDLKEGTNSTGVGIATMASGHSDFGRVTWVPDNRGCFRQSSDSDFGTITGNRIEFPQISLGNDNYTINVWVKLNSLADGGDEIMHVVSNKDGGPVSFNAHLRMNNGFARIGAQAYYSSWTYRYSTTTAIGPGKWYLLTWVNTAQYTGKMYVDGVLQTLDDGNTTWNSRTSNNTPLNATAYAGGETFDGWIGQIQFYSDTLSETEILQNYNAHKCRYVY